MNAQHTPGPWEVETEGDRFVSVVDAETLTLQIAAVNEKRPREVWLANARLIAAAPELLAALHELVTRCDGADGVRTDGSNIQTMRAHAAITKAMDRPRDHASH